MRIFKTLTLITFLIISCETEVVKPSATNQKLQKIKTSSLSQEPYLAELLDKIGFNETKNGRMSGAGMTINTDSILMVLQADSLLYSYTFEVKNQTTSKSFTNLIFKKVIGGFKGFYLQYESENILPNDINHFTGKVTSYNLNWEEITHQYFNNGQVIDEPPSNGKIQNCQPSVYIQSVCTEEIYDGHDQATGAPVYKCLERQTIITLDYAHCIVGGSGGEPTYSYNWSNGTFVPFHYWEGGGGGSGSGVAYNAMGTTLNVCVAGDGGSTLEDGDDPNSCEEEIGIYIPSEEELKRILLEDWEEQINDALLKPCMQTILTDLKNLTQGSVGNIIQKFSGTVPGYNWEMKDGPLPPSENANTLTKFNSTTGTVTTIFDGSKFSNASDLSVARTILHESIHAYIVAVTFNNLTDPAQRALLLGPDWLTSALNYGHDFMTNNYLTPLADALEEYGRNKGYSLSRQFYEDLAWGGLTHYQTPPNNETALFLQKVPSSTDRVRILDIISIELTGKDFYGNTSTKKGSNSGC